MKLIRIMLAVILMAWGALTVAADYDALKPLLLDLSGWTAEAAEGSSMDSGGVKMVMATRNYQRGEGLSLNTQLGLMPVGTAASFEMNLNMETDEQLISNSTVNGFRVQHNHDKKQNSGTVMVLLDKGNATGSLLLIVTYQGLGSPEALELVKQFDWGKMKTASEALLK